MFSVLLTLMVKIVKSLKSVTVTEEPKNRVFLKLYFIIVIFENDRLKFAGVTGNIKNNIKSVVISGA